MMSEAHQNAMTILGLAIGVLIFVIVGVIAVSQSRRGRGKAQAQIPESLAQGPEILPPTSPDVPSRESQPVGVTSAPTSPSLSNGAAAHPPLPSDDRDVELKQALSKTGENFFGRLKGLFKGGEASPALEDVEEILYTSDMGPKAVRRLMDALEDRLNRKELKDAEKVRELLRERMLEIFNDVGALEARPDDLSSLKVAEQGPSVYMIVGVNGAGKTTSIGKLAARFAADGKRVLVAAGDTFRAAAGAQLKVWSDRAQVEIFSPEGVTDPGAVAFDAVAKGRGQGYDVVLIDTAGRLHSQAPLMEELRKVHRVIAKQDPSLPHEVLIVLDANMGQNALLQAQEFNKAMGLTGAILTKMDGTAKGGVALGLVEELGIPVKMIGVGERIKDLRAFSAREFVDSILEGSR